MMKIAVYPGTFDPITYGHIDVLTKAAKIFDKVILAVASYTGKNTLFSLEKRYELCCLSTREIKNIEVESFDGLVVDYAQSKNASAMIRGLRAVSDFEYELSLTLMNKKLNNDIETMFFVPDSKYLYLSSTMIRQIVSLGGNTKEFIPPCVENALKQKLNGGKNE